MHSEDFYKYLEGFNKSPGEYTEEEMLEICCVYKLFVPTSEKCWSKLMDTLGTQVSIDAWDKRVTRFLRAFPEYKQKLLNTFSSSESEKNSIAIDIENERKLLYKQQTKTRDLLNEYRRNMREEARIEDLKDRITEAAKSLPTFIRNPWVASEVECNKCTSEAVVMLSDWHIGAYADNFYNKYNIRIADYELENLCNNVIEYCKSFKVWRLNILNMGDLIHGAIHTNSRIEQEVDVITQIETAGQLLYKVLSKLEQAAPIVTYRSCSDNHSRLMPNKSEHIEKENFGRLIDWWVEAKLEQGKHHIEIIRDNLDFGLGRFTLYNGETLMFAHGHEDNINQAYQNFTGATKEFVNYILLAHYHNPKEKTFQDCKVIVNGSLVGTEAYAMSHRLFTSPCQKLLIFNNGNFTDISIGCNTRKEREFK